MRANVRCKTVITCFNENDTIGKKTAKKCCPFYTAFHPKCGEKNLESLSCWGVGKDKLAGHPAPQYSYPK